LPSLGLLFDEDGDAGGDQLFAVEAKADFSLDGGKLDLVRAATAREDLAEFAGDDTAMGHDAGNGQQAADDWGSDAHGYVCA
jgi:hypothetical protein